MNSDDVSIPLVMEETDDSILLSNTSGKVLYRGRPSELILSTSHVKVVDCKTRKQVITIDLRNVIGAKVFRYNDYEDIEVYRYEYPKPSIFNCCHRSTLRSRNHILLRFSSKQSANESLSWCNAIRCVAYNQLPLSKDEEGLILPPTRRRAVIYVNPMSGKGQALKAWEKTVKGMFSEAEIQVDFILTQRRNHAFEHAAQLDLSQVDFISTVSGDGLIYEVCNGIGSRTDAESALKSVVIAPLPGGSANGLVKSILHASGEDYSLINAVFVALKGQSSPMDLSSVQTKSGAKSLSFLMLGWGLISDVDILSEFLRCLGELRLYMAAVYFICAKRRYKAKLSMFLEKTNPSAANNYGTLQPTETPTSLPPLDQPVSEPGEENGWVVIDSSFVLVWVIQTSHCASTMFSGPGVRLDDGVLTILVVEKMSRFELLELLISFDTGDHVKHPKVKVYKALAYRLEPMTEKGLFAVDGEVVEYGPIQGLIQPGAARVMTLRHT